MKLQRLLMILFYLMNKKTVSTQDLIQFLEVSKRTVYRDLEELKTAGVDITSTSGKGGGHSLVAGFTLDKLLFTNQEFSSLLFSSRVLAQFDKTQFSEDAKMLARKLEGLKLNGRVQENEKVLIDWQYAFHDEAYREKLAMLEMAVNRHETLYMRYESPLCDSMSTSGYVEPYGLVNKVGYWYLAGFCHELETWRALNITFIKNLLLTGKTFKPDPQFSLSQFWKSQKTR